MQKTCEISDCDLPAKARGLCAMHYTRLYRRGDPLSVSVARGGPKREIERLISLRTNECVEWPYAKNRKGYGVINIGGQTVLVSRRVLAIVTGDDGAGKVAAHAPGICHNPKCVNPSHLRWATTRENAIDRHQDGSMLCGDRSPLARLTEDDRAAILRDARTQKEIAADYGVSRQHIQRIKAGWQTAEKRITGKPHPVAGSPDRPSAEPLHRA